MIKFLLFDFQRNHETNVGELEQTEVRKNGAEVRNYNYGVKSIIKNKPSRI